MCIRDRRRAGHQPSPCDHHSSDPAPTKLRGTSILPMALLQLASTRQMHHQETRIFLCQQRPRSQMLLQERRSLHCIHISSQGRRPIGFGSTFWSSYVFALVPLLVPSIAHLAFSMDFGLLFWPGLWPCSSLSLFVDPTSPLGFPMIALILGLLLGLRTGQAGP